MKIFLISNMYPSTKDPLYGVFVKNFKKLLQNEGVKFSAISIIEGKLLGIRMKILTYLKYYFSIIKNFLMAKYDVMYVHYISHNSLVLTFLLILCKKRIKIVINVHGTDILYSKGKLIDHFNKFVLRKSDLLVVPSLYFKNIVRNNYPFIQSDTIYISPSGGVDNSVFFPKRKSQNRKLVVGLVSRIDEGKGWDVFLKAIKLVREKKTDFIVKIAGEGKEEEIMLEMIKSFGLENHVDFLGLVDQGLLVDVYNSFDVMVFPTLREAESLGLVGLEAMTCGIPVIGSDMAGPKTYIKDSFNGYLFSPGDEYELNIKINDYLSLSKTDKKQFSLNAIQTASEYEARHVAKKLKERIEKIC